jgi:hypothetical protein
VRQRRRRWCGASAPALLAILLSIATAWAQPAQLDGLAAVAGDRVIMLSDIRLARDLRLVDDPGSDAEMRDALIDRALMLSEIARFQPVDPPSSAIDRAVAQARSRVGMDAWNAALRRNGVDEQFVAALLADSLRLDGYIRQRFGTLAEPSEEDLRGAYEDERARGTVTGSFETARPALRDRLAAARLRGFVAQWVTELRGRGSVRVTDLLGPAPQR